MKRIRREIERFPRREKVVDIGCGTGEKTACLAGIASEVVGVDIDQKRIAAAGRRHPHIKFYQRDAARTGFSDSRFDTAFMIMFMHEACSDEVIREACRIADEVVIIDYARVLYGLAGSIIRLIEKNKYKKYANVNLVLKFAGYGFSLKESRRIDPNLYLYVFNKGRLGKISKIPKNV